VVLRFPNYCLAFFRQFSVPVLPSSPTQMFGEQLLIFKLQTIDFSGFGRFDWSNAESRVNELVVDRQYETQNFGEGEYDKYGFVSFDSEPR